MEEHKCLGTQVFLGALLDTAASRQLRMVGVGLTPGIIIKLSSSNTQSNRKTAISS